MDHSSDGRSLMSFVTTTRARGSFDTSKGVLAGEMSVKVCQGWEAKNDEI